MSLLTACRPTLAVIPSDKVVVRVQAGHPYTPAINGWFVPDARMLDILNRLDAAKIQGGQ
jgi:hypothetical protein